MEESKKIKIGDMLSKQIEIELMASRLYLMAYQFCNSRKIALANVANFFYDQFLEELTHAKGIIDYMNSLEYDVAFRKGLVDVKFNNLVDVFEQAYTYEVVSYEHIMEIYREAENIKDFSTTQFLDPYVAEQVKSVKDFSDLLVNVRRCNTEFGMFLFDKEFQE